MGGRRLERKQTLVGGSLGQRNNEEEARESGSKADAASGPEHVEAYEEDWYRSLKALAERQQALAVDEEADEAGEEASEAEGGEEAGRPPQAGLPETPSEGRTAVAGEVLVGEPPSEPTPPYATDQTAAVVSSDAAREPLAPIQDEDAEPAVIELSAAAEPPADSVSVHKSPAVTPVPTPTAPPPAETIPNLQIPAEAPAPAEPPVPSLASPNPAQRRAALMDLAEKELSDNDAERVSALVFDPDPDVRRLALDALSLHSDRIEDTTMRQALQDPSDEVRATAVRLAGSRGTRDLQLLAPLVGARKWPLTQRTVLEVLPALVALGPINDEDVGSILSSVGDLEAPVLDEEHAALRALGHVIGSDRIVQAISLPDHRRLGAVRLLVGDESPTVLRALATAQSDPLEEIQRAASSAAATLARIEPPPAPRTTPAPSTEIPTGDLSYQTARVDSLARALTDADESVRHLAVSGLAGMDRSTLLRWTSEALRSGDEESTSGAVALARALGLTEVAANVLERAAAESGDTRQNLVDTLASFGMDPGRLVGLLEGVDETNRAEAVRVVRQVGGPSVLLPLRSRLDDPSIPTRLAVLEVLADSGQTVPAPPTSREAPEPEPSAAPAQPTAEERGESWADALSRALHDPDPNVRVSAVEALQGLEAQAGDLLLQSLSDEDRRVRLAAARRLASQPGDRTAIWDAVRDTDGDKRGELMGVMEQTNPGVLADFALDRLTSQDPEERALAVEIVGWGTTQACVEAAIHALQDPSAPVRRTATESLARLRDPSAAGVLGRALSDPDREVRIGVVRALGATDDESVLGFLMSALNDPDPGVRDVASEVLTQWSSPAVAKRLAGLLAVPGLREAVSDVLARIGPSSVELLVDVLQQGNPSITQTVGELLQRIVGIEAMTERMSSIEPERRLRAAEAVAAIGGPAAADALMRSLSDPDVRIRTLSAQLLSRIGDPRAASAIEATILRDPVPEVVAAAQDALAKLSGQTA